MVALTSTKEYSSPRATAAWAGSRSSSCAYATAAPNDTPPATSLRTNARRLSAPSVYASTSPCFSMRATLARLGPACLQEPPEELLRLGLLRVFEELLRGADLEQLALMQEADAVGDFLGEPDLVGGEEHRHTLG